MGFAGCIKLLKYRQIVVLYFSSNYCISTFSKDILTPSLKGLTEHMPLPLFQNSLVYSDSSVLHLEMHSFSIGFCCLVTFQKLLNLH